MAKKGQVREYVFLECTKCGRRNYRTSKNTKAGYKLTGIKKFCKHDREHTEHKERRK